MEDTKSCSKTFSSSINQPNSIHLICNYPIRDYTSDACMHTRTHHIDIHPFVINACFLFILGQESQDEYKQKKSIFMFKNTKFGIMLCTTDIVKGHCFSRVDLVIQYDPPNTIRYVFVWHHWSCETVRLSPWLI